MAGDPLNGGGFVILNGVEFDRDGKVAAQATPYPGSNLFSLASGGAIYVRDPFQQVDEEQLNGGEIVPLDAKDWELILPYLEENERLFGISVEKDLLRVNGRQGSPLEVYRKVRPRKAGCGAGGRPGGVAGRGDQGRYKAQGQVKVQGAGTEAGSGDPAMD